MSVPAEPVAAEAQEPTLALIERRPMERFWRLPLAARLASLVAVSVSIRVLIGLTSPAPWIIPDELVYSELASSFAESGRFMVRDAPFPAWTYGPLYPILIAPAYLLGGSAQALMIVKLINAVLMSLAAVPAYFLARGVLRPKSAFLLAALAVLVPSGIYTTKLMTESASYPLFLVALLAIVRTLERPSPWRQLAAFAAIALSALARSQLAILLPAFLTAIVVLGALDERAGGHSVLSRSLLRRVATFRLSWTLALAITVGGGALVALGGSSPGALGAHVGILDELEVGESFSKLVWHLADVDLYSGVVPLGAFLIVSGTALAGRTTPHRERVFAAMSCATSIWLLLVASVYSTAFAHVYDRYVFYVVPLFLIALLLWIERGLPRGRVSTWLVAAGVALLPLTLPLSSLVTGREWGTSSSNVALVPWFWASVLLGEGILLKFAVGAFALSLALLIVRTQRSRADRLVRIVVLNFVVITLLTVLGNGVVSQRALRYAGTSPLGWIDDTVGRSADVAAVWPGPTNDERRRFAIWESELFNRSIARVYALGTPLPDSLASVPVRAGARGGLVRRDGSRVVARYVLTDTRIQLDGRAVGRDEGARLVLYEVDGAIRLRGAAPGSK